MNFTWIHISDYHCDDTREFDRGNTLTRLETLLRIEAPRFGGVDAVFFTGDVANAGKKEEYELVRPAIERLRSAAGVSADRVFIIPGNHDVNWKAIQNCHSLNLQPDGSGLSGDSFVNQKKLWLDRFFKDKRVLSVLDEKFDGFRDVMPAHYVAWHGGREPAFVHVLRKGGSDRSLRVGVVGVNSARLVSGESGEHADCQKLVVSRAIVSAAFERVREQRPDVVIVLMHHPLRWLRSEDAEGVERALLESANIVLTGHVHRLGRETAPGFIRATHHLDQVQSTLFVETGAAYDKSLEIYRQGIVIGQWDSDTGEISLKAFVRTGPDEDWEEDTKVFQPRRIGDQKLYQGPRVDHDKRQARVIGPISVEMSQIVCRYGNKAGTAGCVYVAGTEAALDAVREVRYTCVLGNDGRIVLGSRDRAASFAQTVVVASDVAKDEKVSGTVEVAATIEFDDFSQRDIGPRKWTLVALRAEEELLVD